MKKILLSLVLVSMCKSNFLKIADCYEINVISNSGIIQ